MPCPLKLIELLRLWTVMVMVCGRLGLWYKLKHFTLTLLTLQLCCAVTCSESTPLDYQVSVDDNDPPEESFVDEEPTQAEILASLSSSNVSVCYDCVTTVCRQLLVVGHNISVAGVTVAIETAYVAANAPGVTASDVSVNVTSLVSVLDQSG